MTAQAIGSGAKPRTLLPIAAYAAAAFAVVHIGGKDVFGELHAAVVDQVEQLKPRITLEGFTEQAFGGGHIRAHAGLASQLLDTGLHGVVNLQAEITQP